MVAEERPSADAVHGYDAPGDGELIRRCIAAHHLRHSLVAASSETDAVALAVVQGNSVATQRHAYRARQVRVNRQFKSLRAPWPCLVVIL